MPLDTVYLDNNTWATVKVEAVMGNALPPEVNPSLGSKILAINTSWEISSPGQDIYYRREANPGSNDGRMIAAWTHRACFGNGAVYHEQV